jgi:hypothetical protein
MKPYVFIILLTLFAGLGVVLYGRDIWFDVSFSLEIAHKPLSYFTFTPALTFWFCYFLLMILSCIVISSIDKFIRKEYSYKSVVAFLGSGFGMGFLSIVFYKLAQPKDVHPPLSYILLKFWAMIFGDSPISAGIHVLLFGIAGMFFLYHLIKEIYNDENFATIAIIPFMFLSSYLQYFTEVRMYSAFFLYSVAAFYFLVKMIKAYEKTKQIELKYAIPYFGFTALFPWNHYFMIYPFMMQCMYIVVFKRDIIKKIWPWFIVLCASWIPVIAYFIKQVLRIEGMWLKQATYKSFFSTVHYFFFHSNTDLRGNIENVLGYVLVFIVFAVIFIFVSELKKDEAEKKRTFFFMLYWIVPIFLGLIIQMFKNVYHHRYFVFLGWALIMLLVRAVWWVWNKMDKKKLFKRLAIWILAGILVFISLYQLTTYLNTTAFELGDMGDYVCRHCSEGEYTLHVSPFSSVPTQYYLRQCGCNIPTIDFTDLSERQFRSAGGDVINHTWIINSSEEIDKLGTGFYYKSPDEDVMPNFRQEVLLDLEGIQLVRAYPILKNDKVNVQIVIKDE